MVECARLESGYRVKPIGGSNPPLSAILISDLGFTDQMHSESPCRGMRTLRVRRNEARSAQWRRDTRQCGLAQRDRPQADQSLPVRHFRKQFGMGWPCHPRSGRDDLRVVRSVATPWRAGRSRSLPGMLQSSLPNYFRFHRVVYRLRLRVSRRFGSFLACLTGRNMAFGFTSWGGCFCG